MNNRYVSGLALVLGLLATAAAAQPAVVLETPMDKVSYAMGVEQARSFKKQEVTVNLELLMQGIRDGMAGDKIAMPDKEIRRVLNGFQAEVRQKMTASRRLASDENRRRGTDYLEANKTRAGVVALPSGLQYRVLKAGDGRKPQDADQVEAHYRGTLLNGFEFDATEPGKPATLKVAALISGWKEALKLMPVGSRWQIVIPAQLAYGDRGVGNDIGPNETLLFEVELVGIK